MEKQNACADSDTWNLYSNLLKVLFFMFSLWFFMFFLFSCKESRPGCSGWAVTADRGAETGANQSGALGALDPVAPEGV